MYDNPDNLLWANVNKSVIDKKEVTDKVTNVNPVQLI